MNKCPNCGSEKMKTWKGKKIKVIFWVGRDLKVAKPYCEECINERTSKAK